MSDWHDPDVVAQDSLAFLKLQHVLSGIYLWEFVTTISFKWSVFTRQRKYPRWSIWIYMGARLSPLLTIILIFVDFDYGHRLHCKTWLVFLYTFANSGFLCSAALIILRILAIWSRAWIPMAIAILAWVTNCAFIIHNIVISDAVWDPVDATCAILHSNDSQANILATLIMDVILLVLMLWGLVRCGRPASFGILQLLYIHGLFWLLVVTVAEIPTTVFIFLNLNTPLNQMFYTPQLIIMVIAGCRIYRNLVDYSDTTEIHVTESAPSGYLRRLDPR
ncbi:hypothetical protein FA95DRAFT_1607343 [Auriscalpium vulgare]|uniref:Uncharacterized protein n=1 Tax=Auriscalpium vulgare TaxID=40419 RepID=A0ACB8RNR5_9AGAM|nr:hypothetical protein FA95DRAFT_1607343 [Auriscalpium vulgare]